MTKKFWLTLGGGLLAAFASPLRANTVSPLPPVCTVDTLAAYIGLGENGCSLNHVVFNDFAFDVPASGGGAIPVSASQITVTPSVLGERYSLRFSSPGFSVVDSQFVEYLLAYSVDPHPIIRFDEILEVFTPTFPGLASVTTDVCVNANFDGTACPTETATLLVFHNGVTAQLFDSAPVPPSNVLGVRNSVSLQANGENADFSSFTNTTELVPEPFSLLLTASGLCLLRFLRKS